MKERSVYRAEDRRVDSDSQRDGEQGHSCESGASKQYASSVANVFQNCLHGVNLVGDGHLNHYQLRRASDIGSSFDRRTPGITARLLLNHFKSGRECGGAWSR